MFASISNSSLNFTEYSSVSEIQKELQILIIRRPIRSPPLLLEIIKILESLRYIQPQPETLARASIIRNSNTSLASLVTRRKENVPIHEPALNILTTLANLKCLTKGQYCNGNLIAASQNFESKINLQRKSRIFEECLYYVLTYGNHTDVIKFLLRHQELSSTLRYYLLQKVDADIFIKNIFLRFLRCGEVSELIDQMHAIDNRLLIWNEILMQTCRYLEKKNLLNSLYQLQILLKDPIRASMTCVKFYSMNCQTFQQLNDNALHLHNAHMHLQSELEFTQWENINLSGGRRSRRSSTSTTASQLTFLMQMDARVINCHINTIMFQLDVAKFMAKREKELLQESQQKLENRSKVENILKEVS